MGWGGGGGGGGGGDSIQNTLNKQAQERSLCVVQTNIQIEKNACVVCLFVFCTAILMKLHWKEEGGDVWLCRGGGGVGWGLFITSKI